MTTSHASGRLTLSDRLRWVLDNARPRTEVQVVDRPVALVAAELDRSLNNDLPRPGHSPVSGLMFGTDPITLRASVTSKNRLEGPWAWDPRFQRMKPRLRAVLSGHGDTTTVSYRIASRPEALMALAWLGCATGMLLLLVLLGVTGASASVDWFLVIAAAMFVAALLISMSDVRRGQNEEKILHRWLEESLSGSSG